MAPSRRRGSSGKTSATAARSAAIQAAEKRRLEEQEKMTYNSNSSENNNGNNDGNDSTAKGVQAGDDTYINLESINQSSNTGVGNANVDPVKKRKNFSLVPPFGYNSATITECTSSLEEPGVVVTTTKKVHYAQPTCKFVSEDHEQRYNFSQRSRGSKKLYKRKQDFDYVEEEDFLDDEDDDDEDDEGCLHCHQKVKHMPRIRVIDDGEYDGDSDEGDIGGKNIQVRCDDCRGYICNGCHWCHEFQANHEIRVCDRCDAFYCRGCDEMDQCDDCGEVVCGSCSTLLSCKFCGGGLCEECATACGR